MLSLTSHRRYFLYLPVADMRKGFDGLCGLVRNELGQNPLSGDVYIFLNRRRNQTKLLSWESGGLAIYSKRLEQGTYELPEIKSSADNMEISSECLGFILDGIQLNSVQKRKRFSL
jgi:transposase